MMLELPLVAGMTRDERIAAIDAVTMKTREQLKNWLQQTDRRWIVLDAVQFVEALDFPGDVAVFQEFLAKYSEYRATLPTGRVEMITDPLTGEQKQVPIMHGEQLEVSEASRVIRYLLDLIRTRDPTWTLAQL